MTFPDSAVVPGSVFGVAAAHLAPGVLNHKRDGVVAPHRLRVYRKAEGAHGFKMGEGLHEACAQWERVGLCGLEGYMGWGYLMRPTNKDGREGAGGGEGYNGGCETGAKTDVL